MAKKEVETLGKKTVKQLEADIKDATKKMERGVARMHSDIHDQVKENEDAAKKMDQAVAKLQSDIKEQAKENKEAVKRMDHAVRELEKDIGKKTSDFQKYAKEEFWG